MSCTPDQRGASFALVAAVLPFSCGLLQIYLGTAAKPYIVAAERSVAQSMVEVSLKPLVIPIVAHLSWRHFSGAELSMPR